MVHFTGECFFAYEFTESVFTFFSILMCLWGLKALEEKSGALLVLKYVLSAGGAIVLGVYVLLQWDNLYFISQEKNFFWDFVIILGIVALLHLIDCLLQLSQKKHMAVSKNHHKKEFVTF